MPTRGRIPPFLVLFVLAFAFVGLVGFQIFKERRVATANINEKDIQLETLYLDFKEQVKLAHEREKERDSAQTKLLELERASKSAEDSLHLKDSELQNMKSEVDRTAVELSQLRKFMKQKEEEIVHIREKLQDYSYEKAKESAEHLNNVMESSQENRQAEEHKPADEAGLGDRKGLQEEEEEATNDVHLSATEKEMDERSKPKHDVLNEGETTRLGQDQDQKAVNITEEFSKPGDLHEEEAEEQDNADTRDVDEKEIDATQEEDLPELTKLESDVQTGSHEDADAQEADHSVD